MKPLNLEEFVQDLRLHGCEFVDEIFECMDLEELIEEKDEILVNYEKQVEKYQDKIDSIETWCRDNGLELDDILRDPGSYVIYEDFDL